MINPFEYTYPELWVTYFDTYDKEYAQEQFAKGLDIASRFEVISISPRGLWSASKPGETLQSVERIGYHANTAELLKGFLAGSARVEVVTHYREAPTVIHQRARERA